MNTAALAHTGLTCMEVAPDAIRESARCRMEEGTSVWIETTDIPNLFAFGG